MKNLNVDVEVSARHIHLCEKDIIALFGEGYKLTVEKNIIAGYLAKERVTLVGPKRELKNVAILGPARSRTQVELSETDAISIGIKAPLRLSGDLDGTPGIKIIAKNGNSIEIEHGCIVAKRHLHLSADDAEKVGAQSGDNIDLHIDTELGRSLTFNDVIVRIGSKRSVVHLDTDEGNAALTGKACKGECLWK